MYHLLIPICWSEQICATLCADCWWQVERCWLRVCVRSRMKPLVVPAWQKVTSHLALWRLAQFMSRFLCLLSILYDCACWFGPLLDPCMMHKNIWPNCWVYLSKLGKIDCSKMKMYLPLPAWWQLRPSLPLSSSYPLKYISSSWQMHLLKLQNIFVKKDPKFKKYLPLPV